MADLTPDQLIRILRADNKALTEKVVALRNAAGEMYYVLAGIPGHTKETALQLWEQASQMTTVPK